MAPLTVLLTRPRGRAETLARAIEQAGGQVWQCPVMLIEPIDCLGDEPLAQQLRQQILQLDQYQHVIFISTNAVDCGVAAIDGLWPQWPQGIQYYAIGAATAAALRQRGAAGLPVYQASGAMDSETLLAAPPLQQLAGARVLIVRGVGGREHLAQSLRARGAQVDYAECYRRACPEQLPSALRGAVRRGEIDVVCVNSGETLENLCQLLGETDSALVRGKTLLVPSARVADIARARGFTAIVIAQNAGDEALFAALQNLTINKR